MDIWDLYQSSVHSDDSRLIGDIGAIDKLAIESQLLVKGVDPLRAMAVSGVWSSVVHLGCGYNEDIILRVIDDLRRLPEGEFRITVLARFLVALRRSPRT